MHLTNILFLTLKSNSKVITYILFTANARRGIAGDPSVIFPRDNGLSPISETGFTSTLFRGGSVNINML